MFGHKTFLRIGVLADSSISGLYRDSYELTQCEFGFGQGIDGNGKAQTNVQGGAITVTFPNIAKNDMLEWMLKSGKLESGAIVICDANDEPIEKILFEDAACVDMDMEFIQGGEAYICTTLHLQARKITVGETQLVNRWKNL